MLQILTPEIGQGEWSVGICLACTLMAERVARSRRAGSTETISSRRSATMVARLAIMMPRLPLRFKSIVSGTLSTCLIGAVVGALT